MSESSLPVNPVSPIPDLQVQSGKLIVSVVDCDDRLGHGFWWQASSSESNVPSNRTELPIGATIESPIKVMTSCEGTPQDIWPSSSPFQQIVREEIGTEKKLVLLAVGMAGKTHWSGTIEGDAMTEAIAMDFAARVSAVPDFLGSTYLVDEAWSVKLLNPPETDIQSDAGNQSVALKHNQLDIKLVLDSIGPHKVSIAGNRVAITFQADFPATKRNQTLRWRYVLRNANYPIPA